MRKEIFTSVAALATALFLSQGATAQDDAGAAGQSQQERRQSDSNSARQAGQSDRAAGQSEQADSATAEQAGQRAGQAGRSGQQPGRPGQRQSQNFDQKFVEFASTNDQFEIQAAQLAEQQAEDDQIKQAARMIRQDHQQSSQKLQQIAQQAGVQVSQQLKPYQQAMLQELKQLQGQEFDRAWLYGNVAGHTKAVLKFRDATREAQNPQIKQFATQTLPKIQQHLQHAQQLAQYEEAQTAGATERAGSESDAAGSGRSSGRPGARSGSSTDSGSDSATPGTRSGASGTRSGAGSSSGRSGASGASGSSTDRSSTDQPNVGQDTGSGASSDSASGGRSPSR